MKLQIWNSVGCSVADIGEAAAEAEAAGWHGISVYDSQNLSPDCFAVLNLAAQTTERLMLATGINSPGVRHPAVTACAVATLQRISGGRAVLGLGRGDSALAHVGRAPAKVAAFERYVAAVQAYLSGRSVPFDTLDFDEKVAAPIDTIELGKAPAESRLHWLEKDEPKVPLEVACTGPKVVAVAARHADRVMFALGAEPERFAWGMERAREARRKAGLPEATLRFGAYVNLVCHHDLDVARRLVESSVATYARFSTMHGTTAAPIEPVQSQAVAGLNRSFDMEGHDNRGVLPPAFIDRFAIVGPPEVCLRRLEAITSLGLEKITIVGARSHRDPVAREAEAALARHVLPALAG